MEYIRLAKVSDFANQRIKSFKILGGRPVAIIKEPDGSFFATEIGCKHQNADLTTGTWKGGIVTCPRHGWRYDIRTGECLNQNSAKLRRHELKVEGEDILVSLTPVEDEPEEWDEDPFPEFRSKGEE